MLKNYEAHRDFTTIIQSRFCCFPFNFDEIHIYSFTSDTEGIVTLL